MPDNPPDSDATQVSKANLLLSEYEHRHTHCWTMIFRLTAAVVFLSGVPYFDRQTTLLVGPWILLAPGLSLALAFCGLFLMYRELSGYEKVKTEFFEIQSAIFPRISHSKTHRFKRYLLSYVSCLFLCSVASALVSFYVWLPVLQAKGA
jgi:hypothetical protein